MERTPDGKSAWQEFADGGVNLARIVPSVSGESYGWTDKGYELAKSYLDGLASAHMYAWLWLGEDIAHFDAKDTAKAEKLKKVVETFRDHPAVAFWKGEDEPLWGMMNAKEPGHQGAHHARDAVQDDPPARSESPHGRHPGAARDGQRTRILRPVPGHHRRRRLPHQLPARRTPGQVAEP
jgi:hypothetical protein